MAVLSPTVVCCGKAEEDPFSFRDVVLGTSALVKDIAMTLDSSAKTLKSLPDFYSAIEVAPYLNCIKFAAQWTYNSTKRAYINMALRSESVEGLTREECLRIASMESWDAEFASDEDTGHIMFIPDSEELLEPKPEVIYHADTKVQTRVKSTQVDAEVLKEGILGGVNKELQFARSQLSQYTHGSAAFEEDYSKAKKIPITRTEPETLEIPKSLLQELIGIANSSSIGSPPSGIAPMCIAVLEDQIEYFDVASSQWQQLCALRQRITVDYSTSSTFIGCNRVFVCGGGEDPCICHVGKRAYVVEEDGTVHERPNMQTGRLAHGLAWNPATDLIYVFGGWGDSQTNNTGLRSSEQFQSEWSSLPDMHHARWAFNPCWYAFRVYLCGGNTKSVEVFDPQSNTFTLQNFILPEESDTTAVVESEEVTIITRSNIFKLQQGSVACQDHPDYMPWSACTPLVRGGVVYLARLIEKCCRVVDLANGTNVREIPME